jgi:hypothetical protein
VSTTNPSRREGRLLAAGADVLPRQRLHAADGFRAVGDAAGQVRRRRHRQRFDVAVGPVDPVILGRPRGRVRGSVPAAVDAGLMERYPELRLSALANRHNPWETPL